MKILLIHKGFPGQYRGLTPALIKRGHELLAISSVNKDTILNIKNINYTPYLNKATPHETHPWLKDPEDCIARGEAVYYLANKLKNEGYLPDIILAHSIWGEPLFVKKVWPTAKLISYFEYYYREKGSVNGFDPEFNIDKHAAKRLLMRNTQLVLNAVDCDLGITPTEWQYSLHPPILQKKIHIIHDGVNTEKLKPSTDAWIKLGKEKHPFTQQDEIITFINRDFEPHRGYHRFMRALPEILRHRPKAHVIMVGSDGHSYSGPPHGNKSHKQQYLDEVKDELDMSRIHFTGQVSYEILIKILQISSVHIYLTFPFILSWSLMEAMSIGCRIVASKTPPVEEMITHNENGILVDFFDSNALSKAVCQILENPDKYNFLGANARKHIIENYDFNTICLPQHLKLIETSSA